MKVRLNHILQNLESSLWFIPACMGIGAVILAGLTHQLDRALGAGPGGGWVRLFLYSGDLAGARAVLSTVAGSVITVAGVTFSVTMVALSLASSQFGPRLLVNFMRDRTNQLVLGTFISTFVFCLIALGASPPQDIPEFVPAASATMGLLLAVASMAILVYFIHSISSSIRAESIIADIARDIELSMDQYVDSADDARPPSAGTPPQYEDAVPTIFVPAPRSGYVQAVDQQGLLKLAVSDHTLIKLLRRPGHFVVEGDHLAGVVGKPSSKKRIQECFILGSERSGEQDPEYGIHQLVEVAVRALSPGINDPYTAVSCVDSLAAILCRIGDRPLPTSMYHDSDGHLRLVGDPLTFGGLVEAAFAQIRQSAHSMPAVALRILEALATTARHVRDPNRRLALREQADMTYEVAIRANIGEGDRQDLEERYRAVSESLGE